VAWQIHAPVPALLPWLLLWGVSAGPIYVGFNRECVGRAAEEDRGTTSALLESMSHVGGAIAVAAYLTLIGAGLGYQPVELLAAAVVLAGAGLTLMAPKDPITRAKPE
jgi:hypothetical protein